MRTLALLNFHLLPSCLPQRSTCHCAAVRQSERLVPSDARHNTLTGRQSLFSSLPQRFTCRCAAAKQPERHAPSDTSYGALSGGQRPLQEGRGAIMQPPLLLGMPRHVDASNASGSPARARERSELPSYSFPFSLQQLVLLKAYAAADGDVEKVAAAQGTSRTSVSGSLRKLEKELDTELLEPQVRPPACHMAVVQHAHLCTLLGKQEKELDTGISGAAKSTRQLAKRLCRAPPCSSRVDAEACACPQPPFVLSRHPCRCL